jgi:hypothetical protein
MIRYYSSFFAPGQRSKPLAFGVAEGREWYQAMAGTSRPQPPGIIRAEQLSKQPPVTTFEFFVNVSEKLVRLDCALKTVNLSGEICGQLFCHRVCRRSPPDQAL